MPVVSSLSIAHHMPVVTAAPCEPFSQRSTNVRLDSALPLTFVVGKADKTRNNTTHTPTLPLAIPVTTTVDGLSVVENPPGLSTEQEAGVIIGCLLLLIIIGVLLYVYCRRRYGKGSDGPIPSRTSSPPPDPWGDYRTWSSSGPADLPPQPGHFDYPVVDNQANFHRNTTEQDVQEAEEPGLPAEAPGTERPAQVPGATVPQAEPATSGNFNGRTTHPEAPQEPAYTQEQGYQHQNTQMPTEEYPGEQQQEEQPPTVQNPVPPELPVPPLSEHNGVEQAAVNDEASNAHQAAADGEVQSPTFQEKEPQPPAPPPSPPPPPPPPAPQPTTEQPLSPPPPPEQPPLGEAPARHVTFAEPDAEQEATREAAASQEELRDAAQAEDAQTRLQELAREQNSQREQAGQQLEEQAPAGTTSNEKTPRKLPRRKKKKREEKGSNPSESPYQPTYTSDASEMHRIGDEQARRFWEGHPRRVAPPTPPVIIHDPQSPPPPYFQQTTAPLNYTPTPVTQAAQGGAEDDPIAQEDAERRHIAEAWAYLCDEDAQASNFEEWRQQVTYFINQMEFRATYIETRNLHRAPVRAQLLRQAVEGMAAHRDECVRYFEQMGEAPSQATQEAYLEERKPPSSPKREKSNKTPGLGRRILESLAPMSRSRRPAPREMVPDKKKKKKEKQTGLGVGDATQRTAQEAAAGPSEGYTRPPPQGAQYTVQTGGAAMQSFGIAGQQHGSGPVGTSSGGQPVQGQESPPFQQQFPMPGTFVTVEEEGQQNQAEAGGIQSADNSNQQQQGDQGAEPQGTQEEAEVTVQYTDGVTVTHDAERHEQEGEGGNNNG